MVDEIITRSARASVLHSFEQPGRKTKQKSGSSMREIEILILFSSQEPLSFANLILYYTCSEIYVNSIIIMIREKTPYNYQMLKSVIFQNFCSLQSL